MKATLFWAKKDFWYIIYRVFRINCALKKNFHFKTSLLLIVRNWYAKRSDCNSHSAINFEDLLQRFVDEGWLVNKTQLWITPCVPERSMSWRRGDLAVDILSWIGGLGVIDNLHFLISSMVSRLIGYLCKHVEYPGMESAEGRMCSDGRLMNYVKRKGDNNTWSGAFRDKSVNIYSLL